VGGANEKKQQTGAGGGEVPGEVGGEEPWKKESEARIPPNQT